ncbi:interleukin-17A-like [Hemiscyllium ocellatum]|uniref:interleukin-17A-like n=1 Tax=Hemiscyllium ocellatum TaxID=170820 RepID=UPI00296686DB|nr:interleukin-17A-like [Hemiscyllium ocellatum]
MLCKFKLRSLMTSVVLLLVVLTILTEAASTGKRKDNKRKEVRSRTRRNTSYMLELENIKWSSHAPPRSWHIIHGSFMNRSVSPWIYRLDHDPNRYPVIIRRAECVSSHCLNSEGKEDLNLNTRLVKQEMIVLKKEGHENRITYRAELVMVPVACICVLPVVVKT